MCAPEALEEMSLQSAWRGPAFWRSQHDHGPARPGEVAMLSRGALMFANFVNTTLHRRSHTLMHAVDIGALHKIGSPAVAAEEILNFLVRNARQQGRIVDLIAIQMEDREHSAIARRIQELVGVPGSRERTGFRLAIAHDCRNNQLWIVKGRATGMREDVAEFSAFVNRSRSFRRAVTPDSAGEGKFMEELPQAVFVKTLLGIDLGVRPLQVSGAKHAGSAMSRASKKNHIEIVFLDQAVQMDIDKRKSGARSPMAEQTILDVLRLQRLGEQRVFAKVDHSQTEIVAGSPVDFRLAQFFCTQRFIFDGRPGRSVRAEFEDFGWAAGFDRAHK